MRSIAEILEDDKNGKELAKTERQIVVAYIQGKYDAVRELKISNNSNTNEVLDKIRVEIIKMTSNRGFLSCKTSAIHKAINAVFDKHKEENEDKE